MRVCRAVVHRPDVAGLRRDAARGRASRIPLPRSPLRRVTCTDAGGCMTAPVTVSPRAKLAFEVAAAGVAGGIVGEARLRAMPWGLNVAIGTTALVAVGAWLVRRNRITPGPDAPWLAITVLLLGLAFVRRDAATLAAYDVLALIGALAFAAASVQGERVRQWHIVDYLRAGITASVASIGGSLVLLIRDLDWRALPREGRMRHLRGILTGIVIAVPLLAIFAALFASVDQIFANVLQNLFAFDPATIATHIFFICFWGALTAGYVRWALLGRPVTIPRIADLPTSVMPFTVALGLLDALFLLFVVVGAREGGGPRVDALLAVRRRPVPDGPAGLRGRRPRARRRRALHGPGA